MADQLQVTSNTKFDEFVSGCNDDNMLIQIRAIRALPIVAKAMDQDEIKEKLCPFLSNYISSNIYKTHDVLVLLAQQLGDIACHVGNENINLVLDSLEDLAGIDIVPVRHATIQSILKIAKNLDTSATENILLPRILRLGSSSMPSSQCTASALCSVCYKKVGNYFKEELRKLIKNLCQDIFPSIRKTACLHLPYFIEELDMKCIIEEFVPIFEQLCIDDCESIRILSIDVAISIGMNLFEEDVKTFVLSKIATLSSDTSWKVRSQVAERMPNIQLAVGSTLTREYIVTLFQKILQDDYPTVREEATKSLFRFIQYLHETYDDSDMEDSYDPIIINSILPLIHILYLDPFATVKEALASVVILIFPFIGEKHAKELILPLFQNYFISDSYKIKQSILANIDDITAVNGFPSISENIFSIMLDLMNSSASAWRTRRDLICTINSVARQLDSKEFDDHLKSVYLKLLGDPVYGIRRTAPLILPRLMKLYGPKWALNSILPSIFLFAEHKNYLYRFVYLFCIDELILPTLNYQDNYYYTEDMCTENDDDRVKLEITIQNIFAVHNELAKEFDQEWIKENLELLEKHYPTNDCIDAYAEDALETLNKENNNVRVFEVTANEIVNTEGVYLEEVIKLILVEIRTTLKMLAQDPVLNIQIKTAQTLQKINHFRDMLGKLLIREFFNWKNDDFKFDSMRTSSGNYSQESDSSDTKNYEVYFVTENPTQNIECKIQNDITEYTEILEETVDVQSYEQHIKTEAVKQEENEE